MIMRTRDEGKSSSKSPMGGTATPETNNLVNRGYSKVPSDRSQAMDKLISAYNSKAYANPYAPLLYGGDMSYETADGALHSDTLLSAGLRNGDRLGFIGRDINSNNGLEYRAGLDLGDINRGVYDTSINTPIGNLGYGYENDTDHVSYDPNPRMERYIQTLANLLSR